MKYCEHCGVYHEDAYKSCIICGRPLKEKSLESNVITPGYPEVKVIKKKRHLAARILVMIGIMVSAICGAINVMTWQEAPNPWSLIVIGSFLYIWLLISQVIISKHDYSTKVVRQVWVVSIILLIADLITGYFKWSVTYAIPFILATTTVFLPIIVASMPKKYFLHVRSLFNLITLDVLIFLVMVVFPNVIDVNWTGVMALLAGLFLGLSMWIFAPKTTYSELVKLFHL